MGASEKRQRLATTLAILAYLPLAVALAAIVLPTLVPLPGSQIRGFGVDYAAVLLAFLAGSRGGMQAAASGRDRRSMVLSALVVSAAAVALALPETAALAVLIVGFAFQGVWDVWAAERGLLPEAWGRLRLRGTLVVCFTLAALMLLAPLATSTGQ